MIESNELSVLTAITIGLAGNMHCFGMCSGIVMILSLNISDKKKQKIYYQVCYNVGRIIGYIIINIITFTIGIILIKTLGIKNLNFLKLISGFSLIIIALYIINIKKITEYIEKPGKFIWNYFGKFTKKILPVKNTFHALILGIIWSNIPCGLVYNVLIWSISSGSLVKSITLMFFFGLGTLPTMLTLGYISNKTKEISKNKIIKVFTSIIFILLGIINIYEFYAKENCH